MKDPFVIWGSSGLGLVLREMIEEHGGQVIATIDNNRDAASIDPTIPLYVGENGLRKFLRAERELSERQIEGAAINGVVAIGRIGSDRLNLLNIFRDVGVNTPTVKSATSIISQSAQVGFGCYFLPNSNISSKVRIGNGCVISLSATVAHESQVGDGVYIAPGATLCGLVSVEENAYIGSNATILPRITIGKGSVVGAGAVVTRNVKPGTTVVGNPARPLCQDS